MPITQLQYCSEKQVSKLVRLGFGTTPLPDNIPIACAFQWMRDEMEINVEIRFNNLYPKKRMNRWLFGIIHMTKERPCPADVFRVGFKNYKEAERLALDDALKSSEEYVKRKQK